MHVQYLAVSVQHKISASTCFVSRNVRHSLKTEEGMKMFGILMTCMMTWRARGQNMSQMLYNRLVGTMDSCVAV